MPSGHKWIEERAAHTDGVDPHPAFEKHVRGADGVAALTHFASTQTLL